MADKAVVTLEGRGYECPIVVGPEREKAFDITRLRGDSGYVTLDPGYANTASCESAITYIDGERGVLRYRGIPIEELAENSDFIEVADLLIWGNLPTARHHKRFSQLLTDNELLHENLKNHFEGFPWNSHPMAMLSAMINALSCYHTDLALPDTPKDLEAAAARLIRKIRTIAAFSYKMSRGEPFVYPDP